MIAAISPAAFAVSAGCLAACAVVAIVCSFVDANRRIAAARRPDPREDL